MGSLKSPCATSYRSLLVNEHCSSKLLSFLENSVFLHFGDRQTDKQTDGQHRSTKSLSLSREAA